MANVTILNRQGRNVSGRGSRILLPKSPLWSGFLVRSSRSAAGRSVELLLDRGRQILEVTEKSDYLPNLAVGHDISPGGHRSPAHAVLSDVKVLVLRQARARLHELGRPRIEGDAVITEGVSGP